MDTNVQKTTFMYTIVCISFFLYLFKLLFLLSNYKIYWQIYQLCLSYISEYSCGYVMRTVLLSAFVSFSFLTNQVFNRVKN